MEKLSLWADEGHTQDLSFSNDLVRDIGLPLVFIFKSFQSKNIDNGNVFQRKDKLTISDIFVAAISTVHVTIALPGTVNALPRMDTHKLHRSAMTVTRLERIVNAAADLIGIIDAVVVAITMPTQRNTTARLTLELSVV